MPANTPFASFEELLAVNATNNTKLFVYDSDEEVNRKEKFMTREEVRAMILQALQAFAGLTPAANMLPYFTGEATAELTALTAAGRDLIGAANAAAQLTALGAAGLDSPAFTGNPTAPTQLATDNSTKIATTAMVQSALTRLYLDTLLVARWKSTALLNASDATPSTGDAIKTWIESKTGNNFTQSTSGRRGIFQADGSVRFQASSPHHYTSTSSPLKNNRTLYFELKHDGNEGTGTLWMDRDYGVSGGAWIAFDGTSGKLIVNGNANTPTAATTSTNNNNQTTFHKYAISFAGTEVVIYKDGAVDGGGTISALTSSNNPNGVRLGNWWDLTSNPINMYLKEISVYDAILTTEQGEFITAL